MKIARCKRSAPPTDDGAKSERVLNAREHLPRIEPTALCARTNRSEAGRSRHAGLSQVRLRNRGGPAPLSSPPALAEPWPACALCGSAAGGRSAHESRTSSRPGQASQERPAEEAAIDLARRPQIVAGADLNEPRKSPAPLLRPTTSSKVSTSVRR